MLSSALSAALISELPEAIAVEDASSESDDTRVPAVSALSDKSEENRFAAVAPDVTAVARADSPELESCFVVLAIGVMTLALSLPMNLLAEPCRLAKMSAKYAPTAVPLSSEDEVVSFPVDCASFSTLKSTDVFGSVNWLSENCSMMLTLSPN